MKSFLLLSLLPLAHAQPNARDFFLAVSQDFNTAITAVKDDNIGPGGVEVYGRTGSLWHSKKIRLIGSDAVGRSQQGYAAAISADGNTALIGGPGDNGDLGAVWVFTRSEGVWRQQGGKLVGAGAAGKARQGSAVALSTDGDTAIVAGAGDDGGAGAVWVFTRNGSGGWNQHWSQQGNKLVGAGAAGKAKQGFSVALASDGNTALIGGPSDDSETGAAWVFRRTNGVWSQQGDKLEGSARGEHRGYAIVLSAEGNAAVVSGSNDPPNQGAPWQFTRGGSSWRRVQSRATRGSPSFASLRPLVSTPPPPYSVDISGNATTDCPDDNETIGANGSGHPVSDGKSAGGVCNDKNPPFTTLATVYASAGRPGFSGGGTSTNKSASGFGAKAHYSDTARFLWGGLGSTGIDILVNAHVIAAQNSGNIQISDATIGLVLDSGATTGTPNNLFTNFDITQQLQLFANYDECPCVAMYTLVGLATGANGGNASFTATASATVLGNPMPTGIRPESMGGNDFESVVSFVLPEGMTFSFASQDAAAAAVTATTGTPQTTATGSVFSTNLQATVLDADGVPVPHADVTFTAPSSGQSGTFPGGALTADVATDDSGVAISPTFTANATAGAFSVVASVGTATPASFALTNTASTAVPSVTAESGTPQSAPVGTAFATNLQALVSDSGGHALPNVTVTFTAPASGASGTFPSSSLTATATTDGTGTATAPVFTANATAGGPYNVTASIAGVATPANFSLTNVSQSSHPAFFTGEVALTGGVYYLQFPDNNLFGYYNFVAPSILYHYDMGYEAFVPGSGADLYMYDFAASHWLYTSPTLFPYLYDFTLNSWLYYFPDTKNPGHYTANPRSFSNLTTGKIFTM